jgi:hypothetical protein
MSDEGYCKLLKDMILKKQKATGEHEFKIAPADRTLFVKYHMLSGVSSTLIDHPEVKISEDRDIAPRKYHIARVSYNMDPNL